MYANANPVINTDPSGFMSLLEQSEIENILSELQTVSVRASRILDMYDRAAAVVDIVMGVRKMIDFVATLSDSDFAGAFPKPGKIFDFTFSEIAEEFLVLTQAGIRRGVAEWTIGYGATRGRGTKLKAYILYMPSFFWTPQRSPTVGSINGKPVKLSFGSSGKGPSGGDREKVSLMGLGVEMGSKRQLLRMDPGPVRHNEDKSKEIDILPGIYTHMHVYKWNGMQTK